MVFLLFFRRFRARFYVSFHENRASLSDPRALRPWARAMLARPEGQRLAEDVVSQEAETLRLCDGVQCTMLKRPTAVFVSSRMYR